MTPLEINGTNNNITGDVIYSKMQNGTGVKSLQKPRNKLCNKQCVSCDEYTILTNLGQRNLFLWRCGKGMHVCALASHTHTHTHQEWCKGLMPLLQHPQPARIEPLLTHVAAVVVEEPARGGYDTAWNQQWGIKGTPWSGVCVCVRATTLWNKLCYGGDNP